MSKTADKIVRWIKKFRSGNRSSKPPEKREAGMSAEQLNNPSDIVKEADMELKEAHGKLEDLKSQQQREQKSQDRDDITKKLHQEQKQMRNQDLSSAVSLKKLLTADKDIDIVGVEGKKFGEMDDILVGDKGTIYLLAQNQGNVMQAPSYDRIFANPKRLHRELANGMVMICKKDDGSYYQPEFSQTVPKMIWTPEDGAIPTDHTTEKYIDQMSEIKRRNSMLNNKLAAMETSVIDLAQKVEEQERIIESSEKMHGNVKKELETKNEQIQGILSGFDDMQEELRRKNAERGMWEEMAKGTYKSRENMVDNMLEQVDKEDVDIAKEEIIKTLQLFEDQFDNDNQPMPVPNQNQESGEDNSGNPGAEALN